MVSSPLRVVAPPESQNEAGRKPAPGVARRGQHLSMKPRPLASLPGAILASFQAFGAGYGGIVAELLGKSVSHIHRFTETGEERADLRVRDLRILMLAGAGPQVLELLAAENGFAMLPLAPNSSGADLAAEVSRVVSAMGNLAETHLTALTDDHTPGVVDAEEAGAMIEALDRMMNKAAALRAALAARRGSGDS